MLLLVRVVVRSMLFKQASSHERHAPTIKNEKCVSAFQGKTIYFMPVALYLLGSLILWIFIAKPKGHYDVDSYGYDPIASYFAKTGVLTDPKSIKNPPVQPIGYHFILGLLFWLFGHSVAMVIIFQTIIMLCCLILLMWIARALYDDEVAFVVGLLAACNVGFLIYPQLILAETVLLLLLLCFLDRYIHFLQKNRARYLAQAGICLGFSMLVKPVVLLFIFPLMVITYMAHTVSLKIKMRDMLLLLLCFTMPIVCYMGRNYVKYGSFSFAPMTELNIYQCYLAKVISKIESIDQQEIIETKLRFNAVQAFDPTGWQQAKRYFYYYLVRFPHVFLCTWMTNVIKTWLGLYVTQLKLMIEPQDVIGTHSFFNQRGSLLERCSGYIVGGTTHLGIMLLSWIELLYAVVRLLCAVIGLSVIMRNKQKILGWLFLSMMISFSIVTGIDGCCRYRLTFEPVLLLLAAIGLVFVYAYYNEKVKERWYEVSW